MTKRYRLALPNDIGILSNQWQELKEYNGKSVRVRRVLDGEYAEISPTSYQYPIFKVKCDWLEEIKEPETFEDWFKKEYPRYGYVTDLNISINKSSMKKWLIECHEWTAENERKKHEPKQSWERLFDKMYPPESKGGEDKSFRLDFRDVYRACDENRGYEPYNQAENNTNQSNE